MIGTDSTDPRLPTAVKVAAAQTQVADAGGLFTATDVEGVLAELHDQTALTVDTGEAYKPIMYADGRIRAVPVSAVPPDAPAAPTLTAKVAAVRVNWTAVSGATYYGVYRNGTWIASTPDTVYRDFTVTAGETYLYKLRAANAYDMVSDDYSPETLVFVDPALNVAPTLEVRTWPATIPVNQRAIVRINAVDIDAQTLASTIGTDVGTLVGTADPSVWILIPS